MITLLLDNYQDKRNGERKSHHFFYYGSASVVAGQIQPIMRKYGIEDCNDAETGYYSFNIAPNNAPHTDGGILLCIHSYPMVMQLYMSDAYGLCYRHKWYANDWTSWKTI